MCFFASGEEDKVNTYNELCSKFTKFSNDKQIEFIFAKLESFIEDIKQAEAIYFHGGNTPTLLKALKSYSNLELLFSQKTVAGSSAGAYMLAKYGTAHTEESVREGLGIVDKKVVCHFQSPDMPPTESSFAELKKIAPELETIYLKDCEWQVILK
jgi:peptidase E